MPSDVRPDPAESLDQIAARVRGGDEHAFDALFRALYPSLLDYARSIAGEYGDAEELVADVFAAVYARRTGFPPHSTPRAYLFAAVRNRALNAVRGRRRETARTHALVTEHDPAVVPDTPASIDEVLIAREDEHATHALAEQVLARLSPMARQIVLLRLADDLTHPEIAEVLGLSVDAVKAQFSRAMRSLREAFPGRIV